MASRKWLWTLPVVGAVGIGVGADRLMNAAPEPKQDLKPATTLPLSQVVLFNSGVGYFARSGEVEGDARVDLSFPETDVNDLLKSMVLQDFNNGRIAAVSYDSREPISRTLSSFAINLNANPTLAGRSGTRREWGSVRDQLEFLLFTTGKKAQPRSRVATRTALDKLFKSVSKLAE